MRPTSDEARAALARAWLNSSEKQEDFAARNGIAARTLRLYVRRFATGNVDRQVRIAGLWHSIQGTARKLAALERELAEARAALEGLVLEETAQVDAGAEAGAVGQQTRAEEPVTVRQDAGHDREPTSLGREKPVPLPMPGPDFFLWG